MIVLVSFLSNLFNKKAQFMLGFFILISSCEQPRYTNEINGYTMGTSYSIKIIENKILDLNNVSNEIDLILRDINKQMSTWDVESEISKLNRNKSDSLIKVSADLYSVIKESLKISKKTQGAFDVTIFDLMSLWGFGPKANNNYPSDSVILNALKSSGWEKLILKDKGLSKKNPNLKLDLNAIAKGYAVDKVHQKILEMGFKDVFIEIGGEVKCSGQNKFGKKWRVGIEDPNASSKNIIKIINLEDRAMATSGNYRNFVDLNGSILGHTIDPRIGKPIKSEVLSVTVISSSCMIADAWATVLMVMSFKKGKEMIELEDDLDVFWILDTDNNNYGFEKTSGVELNKI